MKLKWILTSFFALFLAIVTGFGVTSAQTEGIFEANEAVLPTKQWTITFSEAVNQQTVTSETIRVEDVNGKEQEITFSFPSATEVKVTAEDGYVLGESYKLFVTTDVKAKSDNRSLTTEATMSFDVVAAVYDEAGTFDHKGDVIDGDVLITAKDVTLKNAIVKGNVIIADSVGDGDVTLQEVTVEGDVLANGGGENTVLFNNVDVLGSLVVHKVDGKIRILATGTSSIKVIVLESGAIVVDRSLTGAAFEKITIAADVVANQPIVVDANVDMLNIEAQAADVTVNGTVKEVQGKAVELKGDVVVGTPVPTTIFEAIEQQYLGGNTSANYVLSNLNLLTSHKDFPGQTIVWLSNSAAVDAATGIITRGENDTTVTLTATVGDVSKTFEVNILSRAVTNIDQAGNDIRFAPGYPKAYLKNGTIHVDVKTTVPTKVYMIVNAMNGRFESSKEGVLAGYGGKKDQLIHIDSWPYVETKANEVISFNTNVSISYGAGEKRVDFVVSNLDDTEKGGLVTIVFSKETVAALDQTGPSVNQIFLNEEKTKLFVYFHEEIEAINLQPTDFTLSTGKVKKIVNVKNLDTHRGGYIEMDVEGVDVGDTIAYTGTSITDISANKNHFNGFDNYRNKLKSAATTITDVVVGNDGKHVMVSVEGGVNYAESLHLDKDDFSITTATGVKTPSRISTSYSSASSWYELTFDDVLHVTKDSVVTVKVNKEGIVNYAYEPFKVPLQHTVTNNISGIQDKTPQTIVYSKDRGTLTLTFDERFKFDYSSFAGGFTVKVGDAEYKLRGFSMSSSQNKISIDLLRDNNDHYSKKVHEVLQTVSSFDVKYELLYGTNNRQVTDIGAALLPAFDYEKVTVQ